jgi:hypothetical protein
MTPHPTEEDLVLHYYGDAPEEAAVGPHLASCTACREAYARLGEILDATSALSVPHRGAEYGRQVWERLQPVLDEAPPRGVRTRLAGRLAVPSRVPRWAVAAALAALVVGAFAAGRWWPAVPPAEPHAAVASGPAAPDEAWAPGVIRERILLVAVGDHLDRSQMVLVELSNLEPRSAADLATTRREAEELVAANRLYRQSAAEAGDAALSGLLEELERTLLELAHTSPSATRTELDALRARIEARGILFKMRIIESNLKGREQAEASARHRQRS